MCLTKELIEAIIGEKIVSTTKSIEIVMPKYTTTKLSHLPAIRDDVIAGKREIVSID